ncbi:hypothetical protein [Methylobacterium sp. SyP6R]|uniref:hypothetical protein n=1 Tax=Methylobacterium sp. SyP6R TaxID=2718876 RepID=UPI001F27E527|nr:hypothetical protein [Methylobacterium sp. SyP6R]MCF4125039.1 hypothetical protein [Methylobacterium sp. SyP6R]
MARDREPKIIIPPAGREAATVGTTAPAEERVIPAVPVEGADAAATVAGSLAGAAAALGAPVVPVEVPGPGVGAERIAQSVTRVEDRPLSRDTLDGRALPVAPAPVIDPATVPGNRRLTVATRITHDGVDYDPDHSDPERRGFYADFATYSEMVTIGAVLPRAWPEIGDA